MTRSQRIQSTLSVALPSLGLADAAAIGSILLVGDTFGYPGSAAYRTYESFNPTANSSKWDYDYDIDWE